MRKIVSLTLSSLSIWVRWHDEVGTTGDGPGCSGWPAVLFLSHCALNALHDAMLGSPSCPLNQSNGFIRAVCRSQSSHAWVDSP